MFVLPFRIVKGSMTVSTPIVTLTSTKVLAGLDSVPRIHFGTGASTLLPLMANAGCDVVGLDWRVALDEGWAAAGHDKAVQGNLDPVVLFAPEHEIERRVLDIVKRADGRPGHIFNLGHGILPGTPPEAVGFVTDLVHRATGRAG